MLRINVKNLAETNMIPRDQLFVSESGYGYSIEEIAEFIEGKSSFKHDDEMPGTFRDFKNVEKEADALRDNYKEGQYRQDLPINMFTENDIKRLLYYPSIEKAFKASTTTNEYTFDDLQGIATMLEESGTLDLIGNVAKKSQILENFQESMNESLLSQVLSEPLADLLKNINELGTMKKKLLSDFTSLGNTFEIYHKNRGFNFVQDIENVSKGHCGAGFNRQISNLYCFLKSHQNYKNAVLAKDREQEQCAQVTTKMIELLDLYKQRNRTKNISNFEELINAMQQAQTSHSWNKTPLQAVVKKVEEEFEKQLHKYSKGLFGKSPDSFATFLNEHSKSYQYPYLLGIALKESYSHIDVSNSKFKNIVTQIVDKEGPKTDVNHAVNKNT